MSADYYVMAEGEPARGPLSEIGACAVRDSMLSCGTRGIRVLRVVEDYEA